MFAFVKQKLKSGRKIGPNEINVDLKIPTYNKLATEIDVEDLYKRRPHAIEYVHVKDIHELSDDEETPEAVKAERPIQSGLWRPKRPQSPGRKRTPSVHLDQIKKVLKPAKDTEVKIVITEPEEEDNKELETKDDNTEVPKVDRKPLKIKIKKSEPSQDEEAEKKVEPSKVEKKPDPPKKEKEIEPPKVDKKPDPPKEEKKIEPTKVEKKTDPPNEEKKVEPPKVEKKSEPPKEEKKVEPPKVEKKPDPPKVEKKPDPPKEEKKPEPPKVEKKPELPKEVKKETEPSTTESVVSVSQISDLHEIKKHIRSTKHGWIYEQG